ncbi:CYTH domain-containing protein [Lacticaseibacillus zhaodongensis]|uniref:CYTH domain-containing protein n=1 Tax=Lacticaseibacillus zhaodongensis TaxID=2668065 RepID=UPI0012D30967|nr:CYTH domain-containing protein [Lacticaseibacillus zhaodongensis]
MSISLEREFKTIISADQAAALRQDFKFAPAFTQTNIYFDDKTHRLAAANDALRIRVFADYAEQTLKAQSSGTVDRRIIEYTDRLTLSAAQAAIASGHPVTEGTVAKQLLAMGFTIQELSAFASMRTTRQECILPAGKLVLDWSHFEDGYTDWELEMEYTDHAAAQKQFAAICTQYKITVKPVQNKIGRASKHHVKKS